MKIVLLLGHSGDGTLEKCKEHIITVLEELDVHVDCIDLHTLPYFKSDQVSPVAALLGERIEASKGVIALTSVHLGGMHSSMQSFFEHFTRYQDSIKDKPLLAIASSDFQGERQAAYQVLQAWSILGGSDGGTSCFNKYTELDVALENIERQIESYYRILKQDRTNARCSEYYLYNGINDISQVVGRVARQTVNKEIIDEDIKMPLEDVVAKEQLHIDLSTKEQNIQELTQLLKQQIGYDNEKEFVELPTTIYKKPLNKTVETGGRNGLKISNIPHYFIAQHDKDFQAVIQYTITDTNEKGIISVKDGDCTYEEETVITPTVEIMLAREVFEQVLKKQLTYQKAFMIGKLKVKGNFGILAKLDQIFKTA